MTSVSPSAGVSVPNYAEIKLRQRAVWASGDYAVLGSTLQPVGESLVEAAGVRAGQRVLDVACGNGNALLAAARRFSQVTGLDYVPGLLARAQRRAEAEGIRAELVEGDAEAMPFGDGAFDVVLSTFGVMFAPDQAQAARELARVVRSGGRVALASWTPSGFIGQLLRTVGKYVPPAPGLTSPAQWGDEAHLGTLFAGRARVVQSAKRMFSFHYLSADHFIDVFRRFYGPSHKAFGSLDAQGQAALAEDMRALIGQHRAPDDALVVPSEYLEVVLQKE